MNIDYTGNPKNREEILKWLKEHLSEERYIHTLGVEECAKELARMYGINPDKAAFAGLLHDCAKCLSNDELSDILKTKVNDVKEDELLNYKTFHAPVGECFAKEIFKVSDADILSSIRFHTLGRVGMSTFEKIIFLADKIEARTREPEYREKILNILNENKGEKGLDMALFVCFKETIKSLVKRELAICSVTIDVYNWLLRRVKNGEK